MKRRGVYLFHFESRIADCGTDDSQVPAFVLAPIARRLFPPTRAGRSSSKLGATTADPIKITIRSLRGCSDSGRRTMEPGNAGIGNHGEEVDRTNRVAGIRLDQPIDPEPRAPRTEDRFRYSFG
jgi:hypothetical protein